MNSTLMSVGAWIPFVFCAFLTLLKLTMGSSADPAYFSFMPMCFFFVASAQVAAHKRIGELERELAQKAPAESE